MSLLKGQRPMAKTKKVEGQVVVKKERKPRVSSGPQMSVGQFLGVYTPLANEGKSAKEIAKAMNRPVTYVSMKATNLRKAINESALTPEQKAIQLAKVPELGHGRKGCALAAITAFSLPVPEPATEVVS